MRYRNYKCFVLNMLVLLAAMLSVVAGGCSDNPENADSKQVRQDMTDALEMAAGKADIDTLQSAQNKVQSSLVRHQQASAGTKEAARLTGGGLALARGRQMRSDLDLKMLPLRNAISAFQETLRTAEDLFMEKERIEGILETGQQEIDQLRQLLSGSSEQTGLTQQLDEAQETLDRLQDEKQQEQTRRKEAQAVLDDYQSRADELLREAEMSEGAEKLALEKKAYAILKDRKAYYVEAQAAEDAIDSLNDQIELTQLRVDRLEESIQEMQRRIEAIETSETRAALNEQLDEVEQSLSVKQQQLIDAADAVTQEFEQYENAAWDICDVFEQAAGEFQQVGSRGALFAAASSLAESYHQAALVGSAVIRAQDDAAYRIEDMLQTAAPAFADLLQERLPLVPDIEPAQIDRVTGFYDQAIEAYDKAYSAGGAIGQEAQCSVLKSQLLAVHSKLKLVDIDMLNLPDAAQAAKAQQEELMQKGQDCGVSFTQSETLKLIEYGIDYEPSLPVNLDVLADQLAGRFSAWKQLPLDQRETAVQENLAQIEEQIERYGDELAQKLEPLRQEMLGALERGFEEPAEDMGEPNSLY